MTIMERKVLSNPTTSRWLKGAITDMRQRDIVDMIADIKTLGELADAKFEEGIELAKVINRAFAEPNTIAKQNESEGRGIGHRLPNWKLPA